VARVVAQRGVRSSMSDYQLRRAFLSDPFLLLPPRFPRPFTFALRLLHNRALGLCLLPSRALVLPFPSLVTELFEFRQSLHSSFVALS